MWDCNDFDLQKHIIAISVFSKSLKIKGNLYSSLGYIFYVYSSKDLVEKLTMF